jgi:hypothetical protein
MVVAAVLVALVAGSAGARDHSDVAASPSAPPPGPAILHAPAADAPQLQNRPGSGWQAKPLLVSGASAMVDGEFLYQGYLYDDHGGRGAVDPQDAYVQKFNFAAKAGTLTYPTDPAFVGNAADLVELRVRPTSDATALRVTLNSLVDPPSHCLHGGHRFLACCRGLAQRRRRELTGGLLPYCPRQYGAPDPRRVGGEPRARA